jgi:3D (Asp-Asp-Asp) domain-containing protein
MQTVNSSNAGVSGRRSVFRALWVLGTLLPAWHLLGMDLFDRTSSDVLAASTRSSLSALMPYPSSPMEFQATAYCDSGITKSGVPTRIGLVAGDPALLPLGSWIHVQQGPSEYQGLYQVMDTGRLIKGKIIDIYMPTFSEAVKFGRQRVQIKVVRYGPSKMKPILSWDPERDFLQPELLDWSIPGSPIACF